MRHLRSLLIVREAAGKVVCQRLRSYTNRTIGTGLLCFDVLLFLDPPEAIIFIPITLYVFGEITKLVGNASTFWNDGEAVVYENFTCCYTLVGGQGYPLILLKY